MKPFKRGNYVQQKIPCTSCGGSGRVSGANYPGSHSGHLVVCGRCEGTGKYYAPSITHVKDCTGCGGIYQCNVCNRYVGWCFGAADDMPNACDDCWSKAHPAPERKKT